MEEAPRISAVILDLDGTLLDTERVTGGILKDFLANYGKVLDDELEKKRLGKMHKESAADIVVDYQLPMTADEFSERIMPFYQQRWHRAKSLPGANRLIRHLHDHGVPLALASNSIKKHIEMKISHQPGWKESFSVMLGGDEVNHGKPFPDIFLEAAKKLGLDISNCLVIEDSPVGVRAAKASGAKVIAVPSLQSQVDCSIANCVLHSLLEFQPELWGLPAFEDWVQDTLPIEQLLFRGLIREATHHSEHKRLNIIADDVSFASLPDQVSGVFFGWAKLPMQGIFKVVVLIGWDLSSGTAEKIIQPHLFGLMNNYSPQEQVLMLLVGYIWKLHKKANSFDALSLCDEDKSVAQTALDLPIFSHYSSSPFLTEAAFGDEASLYK